MTLGRNTVSGEDLTGFVERIERIDAAKKDLGADRAAVMAEVKAAGFSPAGVSYCVKIRAMKPHDRQEAEALRDSYLHAIGLGDPPPLFRLMGMMNVDPTSRESVLAALEKIVPATGDIILRIGAEPVRMWRDKDGSVRQEPWAEPKLTAERPGRGSKKAAPTVMPEVDAEGAEAIGREFARENRAVIENPFPFGDPRRARFDEGWRRETGSDGMGPDDKD